MRSAITRRALGALLLAPAVARAQARAPEWTPIRPIRLIVPYTPGGGTDVAARLVAKAMQDTLGQPIAIENRPGASEMVGTEAVARAAPDGHTIGLVTNTSTINPALYPSVPYDIAKDLRPIGLLCAVPFALAAHPSVPARNVAELIAVLKAKPDGLSYASLGPGSVHGLAMEWFKSLTGTRIVAVPYRGVAPAMQAIATGEVQLGFVGLTSAVPQIEAGRLRVLGVSPAEGVKAFPDWPPVARTVPGFGMTTWYGLVAPAGTPEPAMARLQATLRGALENEEVRSRFATLGVEPVPPGPEPFARHVAEESRMWAGVVRDTGAKPE
ncbi:Bug family tripartite tricarboxylate transporter substrate binding protein [Muricoccus vinaceus]|uniref:Bug family tripartite tricarboxylate transporter substrate binding protein n=1 Tax=Muricoccus vinaceus TaxID=424704 RepID=A0ABV6J153_9PROT